MKRLIIPCVENFNRINAKFVVLRLLHRNNIAPSLPYVVSIPVRT